MPTTEPEQTLIEVIRYPEPVSYADAYRDQVARRDAVIAGDAPEALFLLEHRPVITLGRNAHSEHLRCTLEELEAAGIELHDADRGGDVTYHGPGQLVAYPVIDLRRRGLTIRRYLRMLEQVLIDLLAGYGLDGGRIQGLTGVWVGGAKVAAIGVGARRWVTYHGLALNVEPDMSHFGLIVPCGIADRPVTSLRRLIGTPPPLQTVAEDFVAPFVGQFPSLR